MSATSLTQEPLDHNDLNLKVFLKGNEKRKCLEEEEDTLSQVDRT